MSNKLHGCITGKLWAEQDLSYLKDQWPLHSPQEIAKHLERTPEAVRRKASYCGVKKNLEALQPVQCDVCGAMSKNYLGFIIHLHKCRPLPKLEIKRRSKYDLYNAALHLRGLGYTISQIARILSLKERLIKLWLYGMAPRGFGRCYKLNLCQTPDFAWFIGVVKGDGFIDKKNRVGLLVADEDFAARFAAVFSFLLTAQKPIPTRKYGQYYRVGPLAAPLGAFVKQDIHTLDDFISPFPADFLQGLYDSEGSIHWARNCKDGYISGRPVVQVYNGERDLLEYAREKCKVVGISTTKLHEAKMQGKLLQINGKLTIAKKNIYAIGLQSMESVFRFYEQIGFSIERKQARLEELLLRWVNEQKRLHLSTESRGLSLKPLAAEVAAPAGFPSGPTELCPNSSVFR